MRVTLLVLVVAACSPGALPDGGVIADGGVTVPDAGMENFAVEVVDVHYGVQAGFGQHSFPNVVLGPPHGGGEYQGGLDVLSLGLGGSITLRLGRAVEDGPGPDLVVFENPFRVNASADVFAEPGQVWVSETGSEFVPFPCDWNTRPYIGCAGVTPVMAPGPQGTISPVDPAVSGGDLFDLADVGLSRVRFVRIEDHSLQATEDNAGFDLDAVAAVVVRPGR